jgi:hypothetical protein
VQAGATAGELRIVIVGGGPMATYAVSHLAATLPTACGRASFRLSVFDRGGRFGAGDVHSDLQARSSYLNRAAAQIAFAADESSRVATRLLPPQLRPTFHEWCQARLAETGNPDFDLRPYDVPRRHVHGEALRDMFGRYVALLRESPNITVTLHKAEVTDVVHRDGQDPPFLVLSSAQAAPLAAHHVLFVTGHSDRRAGAADGRVTNPYPLEKRVTAGTVPAGRVAAVHGLGLTAIDVVLHLTEGRGGQFVAGASDWTYQYLRSGREPRRIIAFSPSGIPVAGRAVDQKLTDPDAAHKAVFFTIPAISMLRARADIRRHDGSGRLDFTRHLLPLVVLEMAYVYYRALLGPAFAARIGTAAQGRCQDFVTGNAPCSATAEFLLAPLRDEFARACARGDALASAPAGTDELADSFRQVLYGPPSSWRPPGSASPWGHSPDLCDHQFSWPRIVNPIAGDPALDGLSWHDRVIAFLRADVACCAQGNVSNPLKAACDGVWRDLRAEFAAAVDDGGLRPASQREFMHRYLRYYNRLSNGPGLVPMRKLLALASAGLLDFSAGPGPVVRQRPGGRVVITGPATGVARSADALIEARVHVFDPATDTAPLYRNLLGRGLVRQWRNAGGPAEAGFRPGALDLDEGYHPRSASGTADPRLTFLGAPAEGLRLFQLSAARPRADSYVLNNAVRWAEDLVSLVADRAGPVAAMASSAGGPAAGSS